MLISVYSLIGAVTAMRSREHVDAQIIEVFIACERMTLKQYFGSLVLKEDTAYDCSLYAIFYQAHYIPVCKGELYDRNFDLFRTRVVHFKHQK